MIGGRVCYYAFFQVCVYFVYTVHISITYVCARVRLPLSFCAYNTSTASSRISWETPRALAASSLWRLFSSAVVDVGQKNRFNPTTKSPPRRVCKRSPGTLSGVCLFFRFCKIRTMKTERERQKCIVRSRTTQWLPSPVVVVRDAHVAMWCSRLNPCTHCFRKHASERPFFFYLFLLRSEHARNVSGVSAYDIFGALVFYSNRLE